MEVIEFSTKENWLEERKKDVTSTECSALFGMSPYMTKFELWHRKKSGDCVVIEENQRMKWGTALQNSVAEQVAKDNGWKIRPMTEYIRDEKLRAGSSFDFVIDGKTIIEVKCVDSLAFKRSWIDYGDGRIDAPNHIELQVQHQMMVADKQDAYIVVLVGGNDERVIYRKRDEEIIARIRQEIASFWKSIDENVPPVADFEADARFITSLHQNASAGEEFDATDNGRIKELIEKDEELAQTEKIAKSRRDAIKAEIMEIVGSAERVKGDGFSICMSMTKDSEIAAFTRKGYRQFRISRSKQ